MLNFIHICNVKREADYDGISGICLVQTNVNESCMYAVWFASSAIYIYLYTTDACMLGSYSITMRDILLGVYSLVKKKHSINVYLNAVFVTYCFHKIYCIDIGNFECGYCLPRRVYARSFSVREMFVFIMKRRTYLIIKTMLII